MEQFLIEEAVMLRYSLTEAEQEARQEQIDGGLELARQFVREGTGRG